MLLSSVCPHAAPRWAPPRAPRPRGRSLHSHSIRTAATSKSSGSSGNSSAVPVAAAANGGLPFHCPEESACYAYALERFALGGCGCGHDFVVGEPKQRHNGGGAGGVVMPATQQQQHIVEFGSGDGAPMAAALLRAAGDGARRRGALAEPSGAAVPAVVVRGYETGREAAAAANARAVALGLKAQYNVTEGDFFAAFPPRVAAAAPATVVAVAADTAAVAVNGNGNGNGASARNGHGTSPITAADLSAACLVANPPYLPATDAAAAVRLAMPALWGGADGGGATRALLRCGFGRAVLMVSSYSDPAAVLATAAEEGYAVRDFAVWPLPFGAHTSQPPVLARLAELRAEGHAFYRESGGNGGGGAPTYLLAGVLFERPRAGDGAGGDASDALLRVLTSL